MFGKPRRGEVLVDRHGRNGEREALGDIIARQQRVIVQREQRMTEQCLRVIRFAAIGRHEIAQIECKLSSGGSLAAVIVGSHGAIAPVEVRCDLIELQV